MCNLGLYKSLGLSYNPCQGPTWADSWFALCRWFTVQSDGKIRLAANLW